MKLKFIKVPYPLVHKMRCLGVGLVYHDLGFVELEFIFWRWTFAVRLLLK